MTHQNRRPTGSPGSFILMTYLNPRGSISRCPSRRRSGSGVIPKVLRTQHKDPNDPDRKDPCLRNMTDAPEQDSGFAQHPLSRVRIALQSLTLGVRLSDELKKSAEGKKAMGVVARCKLPRITGARSPSLNRTSGRI